jgi:hypothetical protein
MRKIRDELNNIYQWLELPCLRRKIKAIFKVLNKEKIETQNG